MSEGVLVQAGWITRSTTWDTAQVTVDALLPVKSETLTTNFEQIHSAMLGRASQYAPKQGTRMVQGDLVLELDYNFGYQMLRFAMGTEAAGVFNLANALQYLQVWIDKGVSRYVFPSVAVNRMTLSGRPDEPLLLTLGCVASTGLRVATAFPSLSATHDRVILAESTLRIADQADALAGGDAWTFSGFELTLDNALRLDGKSNASTKLVLQPERNGFRTGALSVEFPRYDSDQFATWRDAHTTLQADIVLNGASADFTIQMPSMTIAGGADANVGGPEVLTNSVALELNGAANAFMAGIDMLRVTRV